MAAGLPSVEQRRTAGKRKPPLIDESAEIPEIPRMRVEVDLALCEGNAVCMKVAPEVFEVRDDDKAYVLLDPIPEDLRAKVEAAERRCPRRALRLRD
jgi:ferredoxin